MIKTVNAWFALGLFLILLPGLVLGEDGGVSFLAIERSEQNDLDLQITSIGGFEVNNGKAGHMKLSYLESKTNGDALALELGGGVSFQAGVTFFAGIGFTLGYNWDNNDLIGAYYPEIGMVAHLTKTFGIIATGKRYSSLYSSVEDENIVMFGFLFGSN